MLLVVVYPEPHAASSHPSVAAGGDHFLPSVSSVGADRIGPAQAS
jgi:hypothetical protein